MVLPTNSTQLTQYTVGALIYHVTQVAAAAVCLFCVCDLLFPLLVSSYIVGVGVGHWHREARATCSVAACLNLGARAWSSGASSIIGDVSGDVRRYEEPKEEEPYTVTSISGSLTPVRPTSIDYFSCTAPHGHFLCSNFKPPCFMPYNI